MAEKQKGVAVIDCNQPFPRRTCGGFGYPYFRCMAILQNESRNAEEAFGLPVKIDRKYGAQRWICGAAAVAPRSSASVAAVMKDSGVSCATR